MVVKYKNKVWLLLPFAEQNHYFFVLFPHEQVLVMLSCVAQMRIEAIGTFICENHKNPCKNMTTHRIENALILRDEINHHV